MTTDANTDDGLLGKGSQSKPAYDAGRPARMLNELCLPTIARLWSEFAQRTDDEGWQATRLLGCSVHRPNTNWLSGPNDALNGIVQMRSLTVPIG